MKKVIVLLVVAIAILSISFSTGCKPSPQDNGLENMPEWATDMMQFIPGDVSIASFCDVRTIRADPVLEDFYTSEKNVYEFMTDLDTFVGFDQLDYWAVAESGLCLVKGGFNLADITESFGDNGWIGDEYAGVEIWTNEELEEKLVALLNGYIIMGTEEAVRETIDVFKGDLPSLYEDPQFRGVMTRLPSGFFIMYREDDLDDTLTPSELIYECLTWEIPESDEVRITRVATAMKIDTAEDYIQNLVKDLEQYEEYNQLDINISRDGKYIILTVIGPIEGAFN